jgi:oxygen-independent coproporphyrinogen-3 oxidase
MEVNPEDIVEKGPSYVESLLSLGVNRISIGVQSFDDGMLKWMNRRHDAARAEEAVRIAREAGADNISLDLIFGISHLTDEVWADTVDKAVALDPEHISCYQLTVEGESVLADMVSEGQYKEASDTLCRRQYDMLCQKLGAAGYHHYEISNFAKEGFEAVHNGGYWERRPYVGIGPGAHSFQGKTRSWNSKVLSGWTSTTETLSDEDARVEAVMLALRTDKGIDAAFLHGNCSKEAIGWLTQSGALVKVGDRYRIPEDHFFVSDEIIRELI